MSSKLYVKLSNIPNAGDGLFTSVAISKGERIVKYKGRKLTREQLEKENQFIKDRAYKWKDNEYIICTDVASKINDNIIWKEYTQEEVDELKRNKSLLRYSMDHNCAFVSNKKEVYIVATRDIFPDEELFISYGFRFWLYRLYESHMVDLLSTEDAIKLISNSN